MIVLYNNITKDANKSLRMKRTIKNLNTKGHLSLKRGMHGLSNLEKIQIEEMEQKLLKVQMKLSKLL